MKSLTHLLFSLFILFLISCNKDTTDNGTNTEFRCLVNGKPFQVGSGGGPFEDLPWQFSYDKSSGILGINVDGSNDKYISFSNVPPLVEGINKITKNNYIFLDFNKTKGCAGYELDTSMPHIIEILDKNPAGQYIKGRFNFTCKNSCEELKITEGYFNVKVL